MSDSAQRQGNALVYLFGAGASYPALPLARKVSQGMIDWGQKGRALVSNILEPELNKRVAGMSEELLNWGTLSSSHYSVDTLAKKLFLTNQHEELWRLKAAMSAFLLLQQSSVPAEARYDSFFAAILEQPGVPPVIPDHVWLLTWNYDRQLERAYHQYCKDSVKVQENITASKRVVRLNGLLGRAINKGTGDEYNLGINEDESTVFGKVSEEYWQLRRQQPTITFAFEKRGRADPELRALSGASCTLVVIGYSFPFFNRHYDSVVLQSFSKIEKVYLQVLPNHAKAIESRMRSLRELPSIEFIDDNEQFYVPYVAT